MYTAFTTDTKRAVTDCWNAVSGLMAQQETNKTRYLPDYAEQENKKLDEKKTQICVDAREKVRAIADKATEDAGTLDTVNPFDINDTAMKLLNGAFTLSVPQLQHVVDEYAQKSPTMQNAIATYAEAHGMRLVRATSESRRNGIAEIRDAALSLIGQISAQKAENQRGTLNMPLIVSDFCVDGDFARATGIYSKLGQRYDGTIISPTVTKAKPFDLSFRGVRDDEKKAG